MDISVTEFKAHCLDLIRKVEQGGKAVTIRRRGRIVARLEPAGHAAPGAASWEQLRALGGSTRLSSSESAFGSEDFEALR